MIISLILKQKKEEKKGRLKEDRKYFKVLVIKMMKTIAFLILNKQKTFF